MLLIALAVALLAPSAASAQDDCSNAEYRVGLSAQLPDCRAYEMVSPSDKQGQDVRMGGPNAAIVSPDGNAVTWDSIGNYADGQGSAVGGLYAARRSDSGWVTRNVFPPASQIGYVPLVFASGMVGFSADLVNVGTCGSVVDSMQLGGFGEPEGVACNRLAANGEWTVSPTYSTPHNGVEQVYSANFVGASEDFTHSVFQLTQPEHLLPADTTALPAGSRSGIYEIAGLGSPSPTLRLVNVDNDGKLIGPATASPTVGSASFISGDAYQAISDDGNTIYFTATPTGGVATLYARRNGTSTVTISDASQCTTCDPTARPATYQGASADGSKAFFLTTQQLVNADTDGTTDLYEYDFARPAGQRVVQLSRGGHGAATPGNGADVQGVVRTSSDGSRVYFVAKGVLTTLPNELGETAAFAANNLYVYTRNAEHPAGRLAFVTALPAGDALLWSTANYGRAAWATPDGGHLLLQTQRALTSDDTDSASDVYRYAAETGELVRVSTGRDDYPASSDGNTAGMHATLPIIQGLNRGASPDFNSQHRSMSDDGSYAIFTTGERLQGDDQLDGTPGMVCEQAVADAGGCDTYVWHDGEVSLLSDGRSAIGANTYRAGANTATGSATISASGADVFFSTDVAIDPRDKDELADVYVARIGGGFPPPQDPVSCDLGADACQARDGAPIDSTVESDKGSSNGNAQSGERTALAVSGPVSAKARRRAASRGVLPLSVRLSTPGSVVAKVRARLGRRARTVGTARTRLRQAGTARLAIRLGRPARRALRAGRGVRLSVTVEATGARKRTLSVVLPGVGR